MKPKTLPPLRWIAGAAIVLTAALVFLINRPVGSSAKRIFLPPSVTPGRTGSITASDAPTSGRPEAAPPRPFPVSLRSTTHEWAEGDGSDPAVIEKLAHNPDEFIRMVEENERIKRRQLVYRQDTAAAVVQRARATGEPIGKLTLPGLDGREIEVEVTGSDLAFSGLSGTFTGRLPGKLQSIVTLAFKNNREAFSVSSPEDSLFLEAEPREPGEVIIKEIDPSTYVPGKCGNPDHNH